MEFTSLSGPSVVVDAINGGQRLQAFACRAFREQLGRLAGGTHSDCKLAAQNAIRAGLLQVNGSPGTGRRVLEHGDVVTLAMSGVGEFNEYGPAAETQRHGRQRMALCVEEQEGTANGDDAHSGGSHRESTAFRAYYAAQVLCSPDIWVHALAVFRRPLPICLRFAAAVPSHTQLAATLAAVPGVRLRELPWVSGAWTMQVAPCDSAGSISAESSALGDATLASAVDATLASAVDATLASAVDATAAEAAESVAAASSEAVTRLLLLGQSCGEVVLQEAAAMLPAALLRPQPHHYVLDLCAAPGGKTLQLLDAMISGAGPASSHRGPITGLLVSNDCGWQRQERTVRRARTAPCVSIVATVADAAHFALRDAADAGRLLQYDAVLCDVPCGGDGTLRKSPEKSGGKWSVATGLRAHSTQLAILRRGVSLLRAGGRLAYSTCALDPLQNEAVVHALLRSDRSMRLVPPTECLPPGATGSAQRFLPGLCRWRVPSPRFGLDEVDCMYDRWEDVPSSLREPPDEGKHAAAASTPLLRESMFPPSEGSEQQLAHCLRVLPSCGDEYGGFFVALMERISTADGSHDRALSRQGDCDWCDPAEGPAAQGNGEPSPSTRIVRPAAAEVRAELADFFGLAAESTALPLAQLVDVNPACAALDARGDAATEGVPWLLSLVPSPALDLCIDQPQQGSPQPLTVLAAGQPVFARMPATAAWWPASAPWRICQESAALLCSAGCRRVLHASTTQAARELLSARRTPIADLAKMGLAGLSGLIVPAPRPATGANEASPSVVPDSAGGSEQEGTGALAERLEVTPGAVILALPPQLVAGQLVAVAALLTTDALVLLASEDLLDRYLALCRIQEQDAQNESSKG